MSERTPLSRDEEWRYAEPTFRWHGWASPVGLGLAFVCVGIAAVLIRFAILGL
jgi:hypothetical protein